HGQLPVELARELARVVALDLDQLLLDRSELLPQALGRVDDGAATIALPGPARPVVDLPPDVADRVHRLVHLAYLVADGEEELELLRQVLIRGGDARVLQDAEGRGLALFPDRQAHLIGAGNHDRPVPVVLGRLVAGHHRRPRDAHIPDEAVEPGILRDTRLLLLFAPRRLAALDHGALARARSAAVGELRRLGRLAREGANLVARFIEDGQGDLAL